MALSAILNRMPGRGTMPEQISSLLSRKINRLDLSEQIADNIEEMIAREHLIPGTKLPPERELAQHFSVSRPTVSAALNLLQERGLVGRSVGRGTLVKEIPRVIVMETLQRYFRFRN